MRYLLWLLFVASLLLAAEEPGFTPLLGKDLRGWKAKKSGESLEGQTETFKGRFTVRDGVLRINPKVKGDLTNETIHEIKGDVVIRFEFKPGKGCNNDLFFRGQKFDILSADNQGKALAGVKLDIWNTMAIPVVGDTIEFQVNGQSLRKGKTKKSSSTFGICAEFGPIEIRNLRIKEGNEQHSDRL
ncbi:MAG: DUF1080 domain-containing protein [Gemmataceae bacterium]